MTGHISDGVREALKKQTPEIRVGVLEVANRPATITPTDHRVEPTPAGSKSSTQPMNIARR